MAVDLDSLDKTDLKILESSNLDQLILWGQLHYMDHTLTTHREVIRLVDPADTENLRGEGQGANAVEVAVKR